MNMIHDTEILQNLLILIIFVENQNLSLKEMNIKKLYILVLFINNLCRFLIKKLFSKLSYFRSPSTIKIII